MSIENMIADILGEATESSRQTTERAEAEAAGIMEQAKRRARELAENTLKKGEAATAMLKDRKISIAELEARKLRLGARQKAVAKCFDAVLKKLENMEEAEYVDFLGKKISKAARDGDVVLLNEKDMGTVGRRAVDLANTLMGGEKVSLGEETVSARGGFVLQAGAVEINSTLEAMIASVKEDVIPEVAAVLFK
ncbi:MAG TPA: V-type ATP synthase subunit E [Anaerovoracaceae bacterium]|nr:V-type ATP synthase subunit E [Anaerovoracaceae bacterium]